MKDLASALGLTVPTISRALAGHPDVSQATQQRVRELAQEMNYRPNRLASGLRNGRSGIIGVVVPHITGYFFPEVIHAVSAEATKAGYSVMICESNESEQQQQATLEILLNAQVEGILISIANTTADFSAFGPVLEQQVPLVFFDRVLTDEPTVSTVVLDDYRAAYQLVTHLIEQGCTRIAHLTGALHLNVFQNRLRGYTDALIAHGLPVDEQLICRSDMSLGAGRQAMNTLLALPQPPDAICSSKDIATIGAWQVLTEHGLQAPHDVALASFGNDQFTALALPFLTSVDQQAPAIGEAAAHVLLDIVQHPGRNMVTQHVQVAPHVEVRGSSQRLLFPRHNRRAASAA